MGENGNEAAAALAGYAILSDTNGLVDLNRKAGGGWGSKGEKVVYLGYKTTDDADDAITDLAVMNMKGGYSVQDYEALMDAYVMKQINPLLDRLITAIEEYRVNFRSENENNRLRAAYIHSVLNKLIDDDTGKGLGNLLLNPTKYEMGDQAYEALSDNMKQNTADIVTILCQANGRATLILENLIARAADNSDDTWLDRFAGTTYEDLIDEMCTEKGMLPSDAEKEAAMLYEDDALKLKALWNDFYTLLSGYNEAEKLLENFDAEAVAQRTSELAEFIENFDEQNNTAQDLAKALNEHTELLAETMNAVDAGKTIAIYEYLDQIEYGNGTMLDFFKRNAQSVAVSELYPLAASFSEGQKAGLDFISLFELVTIAITDGSVYSDDKLDSLRTASIYEGVNRDIGRESAIIILTAYRWDDAMDEALRAGVDSFLPKPIFAAAVLDEFRSALKRKDIPAKKEQARADLKGKRILLAEDMNVNAEIMLMVLRMREMTADRAENGKIAVDLFAGHPEGYYDAILMDMRMPEMDGLEAAQTIRTMDRADAKTVPIIALTANAF